MAKMRYPVLSKLTFDGKDFGPAEDERSIVLDEKVAGPLQDAGVLAEGVDVVAPEGEERIAALVDFVQTLAIGDFTSAGGLRADAKRRAVAALGFEPTDDEMRAAAEAYGKRQAAQS